MQTVLLHHLYNPVLLEEFHEGDDAQSVLTVVFRNQSRVAEVPCSMKIWVSMDGMVCAQKIVMLVDPFTKRGQKPR